MSDTLVSGVYVYVRDNGNATPTAISLATAAFAAMSYSSSDIDDYLVDRVDILFKDPGDMPNIPGTSKPAWGYTFPNARECWINNKINGVSLPPNKTKHTILHEVGGHMGDEDVLNGSKRTALKALMHPDATGVSWGGGSYQNHPDECSADTFPRAFADINAIQNGYYGFKIYPADYSSYITIYGGAGGPASTVLTSDANIGDELIMVSSITGLDIGDWIEIVDGSDSEQVQISSLGLSGPPYEIDFDAPHQPLTNFHASGTTVREIPPSPDPGGPGARLDNAIGVAGNDYTLQISADSIKATESGSEFNGTFEFTIRVDPNSDTDLAFDDSFPWADVYWTFNGYTLFGGVFMGATRKHGVAGDIYYECRAVSYDSWLDRRVRPTWFTTDDGTALGTPIDFDGDMIIALLDFAAPFIDASLVNTTNTSMPLIELPDGTLREHISRIAEQANDDGVPRRAYIDFNERIHYFYGTEGSSAPYTIGDDPGSVDLIPDYIEFDTDFNDSGSSVYINGTGINDWVSLVDSAYDANTIIDRPEVLDSGMLTAAGVAFLSREYAPKYMVRFIVEGYHGWRAGQSVTFADAGLGVSGEYEIRSIDITPSEGGNDQITYEITCGSAPWRGTLDIQRKIVG